MTDPVSSSPLALSIVIPMFEEAGNVQPLIDEITQAIRARTIAQTKARIPVQMNAKWHSRSR